MHTLGIIKQAEEISKLNFEFKKEMRRLGQEAVYVKFTMYACGHGEARAVDHWIYGGLYNDEDLCGRCRNGYQEIAADEPHVAGGVSAVGGS